MANRKEELRKLLGINFKGLEIDALMKHHGYSLEKATREADAGLDRTADAIDRLYSTTKA